MGKDRLKVVGLGGSLAQHSTSLAALRIALEGAVEAGAKLSLCPCTTPPIRNRRSRSSNCVTRFTGQMG